MAKKTTLQNIPLETQLNLDYLKSGVTQFSGTNKCNSTTYNSALSPFYTKTTEKEANEQIFVSKSGDIFKLDNDTGDLYKNDIFVHTFSGFSGSVGLVKEKLDLDGSIVRYFEHDDFSGDVTLEAGEQATVHYGNDQFSPTGRYVHSEIRCSQGQVLIAVFTEGFNTSTLNVYFFRPTNGTLQVFKGMAITIDYAWSELAFIWLPSDGSILFCDVDDLYIFSETEAYKIFNIDVFNGFGTELDSTKYVFPTRLCQDGNLYPKDIATWYSEDSTKYLVYSLKVSGLNSTGNTLKTFVNEEGTRVFLKASGKPAPTLEPTTNFHTYNCRHNWLISGDKAFIGLDNTWFGAKVTCGFSSDGTSVNTNFYGSRYRDPRSGFCIIYKNGLPSALSYSTAPTSMGTLVSEWLEINDDVTPVFIAGKGVIYKDDLGDWYKVTKASVTENENGGIKGTLLDNRYLVTTSTLFINTIDLDTLQTSATAVDYNSFFISSRNLEELQNDDFIDYFQVQPEFQEFEGTDTVLATAVNPLPNRSLDPFISIQNNPVLLTNMAPVDFFYKTYGVDTGLTGAPIDIYTETGDPNAVTGSYLTTLKASRSYSERQDQRLVGTKFPITLDGNILYNIDLFAEIKKSYVNSDLVISGNTGAPLVYSTNLQEIFAFYSQSRLEYLSEIFVIQGQIYAIINDLIYAVTIESGVIIGQTAIVDITGFTFLGSNTQTAIFHSKANKSIFQFTGDRVLSKIYSASEINNIYNSWYNPATYTITISADIGLIFVSLTDIYSLNIEAVDFQTGPDTFFVFTEDRLDEYSQVPKDGFEKVPIEFETRYYGTGNNMISVIDCWYLRFYDKERAAGTITLNIDTITDTGLQSESKTVNIKESDWDKNNSFYLRYQPKFQRSVGSSLSLTSDFALYQLDCSISTESTAQVSKVSI